MLFQRQYCELFSLAWEDELPISRRARKLVSNSLPINASLHSSNEDSEVVINSTILFKVFLSYQFYKQEQLLVLSFSHQERKKERRTSWVPAPCPYGNDGTARTYG